MNRSILIVDDDPRVRASLPAAVEKEARSIRVAENAESALAAIGAEAPDVVLTDVRMPGMDGLELLRLLRERAPGIAVILMTAFDDLPTVAMAMREGAVDFLVKPLELNRLRAVLRRVFEDREARQVPARSAAEKAPPEERALVGHDPRMIEIFKLIGQLAGNRISVVIRGESGTGKELIARAIHEASPYADRPFVAVNCTALPSTLLESELFGHVRGAFTGAQSDRRGRFALAGKGTLFLDEIGDTSTDFQAKLLRVLQEHEYYPVGADVPERMEARVITATHRDLEQLIEAGAFREDLYYRLRVVEIDVPPLRERMGDVPLLAKHLIAKVSAGLDRKPPTLTKETASALLAHDWPGNVRELENCLTRAVVLATGDVIRPEHLQLGAREAPADEYSSLEAMEREHVARVLRATRGHKARAAEILRISRPRLDRLIEKHELGDIAPGRRMAEDAPDSPPDPDAE